MEQTAKQTRTTTKIVTVVSSSIETSTEKTKAERDSTIIVRRMFFFRAKIIFGSCESISAL